MRRGILFIIGVLPILAFPTLLVPGAYSSNGDDGSPGVPTAAVEGTTAQQAAIYDDSNPSPTPEVDIPAAFQPDGTVVRSDVTTVYFTPMDENESTSVFFFFNTKATTQTVGIETFELDGSVFIDTTLAIPPNGLVRMAADPTDGEGSATWEQVALVNFTTFSTYGRLSLPAGVMATGYIAWNGGSTYFPRTPVHVLDMRFSTDPPSPFSLFRADASRSDVHLP